MSSATLIAILTAILNEAPELIQAVKDFVAAFEGRPSPANQPPLGPQVAQDTAQLDAELKAPLPPKPNAV